MVVAPEVFGGGEGGRDPCPRLRKYVEVAYKCKPTQFRSKVICHSQTLHLDCDKKRNYSPSQTIRHRDEEEEQDEERLAIYSSAFASAVGSHIYCPEDSSKDLSSSSSMVDRSITYKDAQKDASQKCESSYATEAVMQMCHGQRKYHCTSTKRFILSKRENAT